MVAMELLRVKGLGIGIEGSGPDRAAGPCRGGLCPSGDAPGAAGEELGAGDLAASLEGFLDGGLIRLGGGFDGEPFGIESLFVVDHHRLGFAAAELVIGEGEAGGPAAAG